jgi:2-methylaconitate cis-trans-isomerase PrpF
MGLGVDTNDIRRRSPSNPKIGVIAPPCLGVAARIDGTVVNANTRGGGDNEGEIRILQPSGLTVVGAEVDREGGAWHTRLASVYRTQRRLFEGSVLIPASRYPAVHTRSTPEPELQ